MTYIAENGTLITDDMVDQWASEAEAGFPGAQIDTFTGHPEDVHTPTTMTPHTIRTSAALWNLIEVEARRRGMSTSAWTRQALADALARART